MLLAFVCRNNVPGKLKVGDQGEEELNLEICLKDCIKKSLTFYLTSQQRKLVFSSFWDFATSLYGKKL